MKRFTIGNKDSSTADGFTEVRHHPEASWITFDNESGEVLGSSHDFPTSQELAATEFASRHGYI